MKQRDTLILFGILILLSFCMGHACVNVHAFWTEPVILWVACAITGIYICLNSTSFFFLNSFSFYYPTKNPLFLSCLLKIVGCLNQSFSVLYFCFLFSLSVMTTNRHTIMIVKREVLTFKRKLLWMQKRIPTSYSVHFIFGTSLIVSDIFQIRCYEKHIHCTVHVYFKLLSHVAFLL